MFRFLFIILFCSFAHAQSSIEDILSHTQEITVVQVRPVWGRGVRYEVVAQERVFNANQRAQLLELLQNKNSFLSGIHKKCLFVPEYLFLLRGEKGELQILVNPSGKQIEVIQGGERDRKEADPCFDKIKEILSEIYD